MFRFSGIYLAIIIEKHQKNQCSERAEGLESFCNSWKMAKGGCRADVKPERVEALIIHQLTTAYSSHFIGKKVERLNDLFKLVLTQLVNTLYSFIHSIIL